MAAPNMSEQPTLFAHAGVQNSDIATIVNAINYFRTIGVDKEIALPQLVVVGNQSAGKSTLLESLTGLPFPVGIGVCTRFPVEVELQRRESRIIETSIIPAPDTEPNEKDRLAEWKEKFNGDELNSAEFAKLFAKVSDFLKIPQPKAEKPNALLSTNADSEFSGHKLKIAAPCDTDTTLSFVDTPGLFTTTTDPKTSAHKRKVEELVQNIVSRPRSIVVLVMDARQDIVHQGAFDLLNIIEKAGNTTLGVLTKCDQVIDPDELGYAEKMANNIERPLENGWYVVRCRDPKKPLNNAPLETRRKEEDNFLATSEPWDKLSADRRGSSQLRKALEKLFAKHLRQEFPKVIKELHEKIKLAREQLAALGPPRSTAEDQRKYLTDIAEVYHKTMQECLNGSYQDSQAGGPRVGMAKEQARLAYREVMFQKGLLHPFLTPEQQTESANVKLAGRVQTMLTQEENGQSDKNIYGWINRRCIEETLPSRCGLVPQKFVDGLFSSLIDRWLTHAYAYLNDMYACMKRVILTAAEVATKNNSTVAKNLSDYLFSLAEKSVDVAKEAAKMAFDNERLGIDTSNDLFVQQIQRKKAHRLATALSIHMLANQTLLEAQSESTDTANLAVESFLDRLKNLGTIQEVLPQPMHAVYDIHDILETYCDHAGNRYFDHVVQEGRKLFNERDGPLVQFSSRAVQDLSEKELHDICGEDAEVTDDREKLEKQIQRFQEALDYAEEIRNRPRSATPANGKSNGSRLSPVSSHTLKAPAVDTATTTDGSAMNNISLPSRQSHPQETPTKSVSSGRGNGHTLADSQKDLRSSRPSDPFQATASVPTPPASDRKPSRGSSPLPGTYVAA